MNKGSYYNYIIKRFLSIFVLFFTKSQTVLADANRELYYDENIVIDNNFINNNRIKINLLEPCIVASANGNEANVKTQKKYTPVVKKEQAFVLDNIYKKISSNLKITKLYDIGIDKNSCRDISNYIANNEKYNISNYILSDQLSNFDFIVTMLVFDVGDEKMKLQVMIWDILEEKFVDGHYYILDYGKNNNSYRVANLISDFIFTNTTNEGCGIFDSKIAYVAEVGGVMNRKKQISIINFDGTNNVKVTSSKNLKLTPVFSRYKNDEIFYLEYLKEGPFVIKHNLTTNSLTKISSGQIMTTSASVNPNKKNNQIVIAGTNSNADTNLYLFDFKKMVNKKLTDSNSINTAASFSSDGKEIVYVSDRSGVRKLYVKNLEDNTEKLISKGQGIYDKPSWSPDGKLISFVKIANGQFYLGLMTPYGDSERYIMSDYLIEGVKWSPNSRYLIYTKQKDAFGKKSIPKIYIIDILTGDEYQIKTPENEGASDPDWIMNF